MSWWVSYTGYPLGKASGRRVTSTSTWYQIHVADWQPPTFPSGCPWRWMKRKRAFVRVDVRCFPRLCGCFKKSVQSIQIAANFRGRAFLFSRSSIPVLNHVPSHAFLLSAPWIRRRDLKLAHGHEPRSLRAISFKAASNGGIWPISSAVSDRSWSPIR